MTARFALLTDTTSDIPADLSTARSIYMIPQIIIWGRESLREGQDIDAPTFYERLAACTDLPTTSRPVPVDTADLLQRARDENDAEAVVVLTVSKELSGTVSSVEEAMKRVDFPVYLLDTRTISLALGLTVLQVADARDRGASPQEALDLARKLAGSSLALFTPNTLAYLYRGGRIGGAQHLVGTALSIKPILTMHDGQVDALESVRTRKRAIKRMIEITAEHVNPNRALHLGVVQGNVPDEAALMVEAIKSRFTPDTLLEGWIGASIGVHAGPGVLGILTVQS